MKGNSISTKNTPDQSGRREKIISVVKTEQNDSFLDIGLFLFYFLETQLVTH